MQGWATTVAGLVALAAMSAAGAAQEHERPRFIAGDIIKNSYDGTTDDLLTAGLGAAGLQSAAAPASRDKDVVFGTVVPDSFPVWGDTYREGCTV